MDKKPLSKQEVLKRLAKRKPQPPRKVIITLAKLLAKDVAKAKLTPKLQKKLLSQLSKLLSEVDHTLQPIVNCWCYYRVNGTTQRICTSLANCISLPGLCDGLC